MAEYAVKRGASGVVTISIILLVVEQRAHRAPCGFEPDVIVIKRQEGVNPDGDLRCLFSLIIIKNILSGGRYIAADGYTAATNGSVTHDPEGYANNGVSYTDGAICGKPSINGRNLLSGYAYDYIFGRCGL